jgi:hypothetical protein
MNNSWLRTAGGCLAVALAVLATACGDTTVQGNVVGTGAGGWDGFVIGDGNSYDAKGIGLDSQDGQASGGGGGDSTAGEDAPVANLLTFAHDQDDFGGVCDTLCALKLNQNGTRKIGLRYFVAGKPAAEGIAVEFKLLDEANKTGELLTANVFTDAKGEAWAEVKSGTQIGKFSVLGRVPDDPDAGQLQFDLTVVSKAKGPLTITPHYVGNKLLAELGAVQVRLVKQVAGEPACSKLDLGDTLPAAAWTSPNLKWDKPWALTFSSLAGWVQKEAGPDGTVSFTVIGLAYPASGGNSSKQVAGGCLDTGVTVKIGPSGVVEGDSIVLDYKDLPPRLKGTYDLVTRIDLLSVLPDTAELVVKTIFDVLSDPIAGLLGLACKLSNQSGGNSLATLCKTVFNDPAQPSISDLSTFGDIITKFLNAIILSYLPPQVQQALGTAGDLNKILTNLEMGGVIEVKAEPDAAGFVPAAQTKENWTTVTYKWSLGQACSAQDPNCGKKTFNIEAFQSEAIVGQFDLWRNEIKSTVKVGKHSLKIKWGALVNYIVQKQLLPALTADKNNPNAPVVDSYAKLIKSLMAGKQCLVKDTCCGDFAKQLSSKQSFLGEAFLTSTCELLVTFGTTFLEGQLTALDANSGDPTKNSGLLLGVNECPVFETNQDQLIDLWGGAMTKDQCKWDMTITIAGKPQPITSTFYATRQQ